MPRSTNYTKKMPGEKALLLPCPFCEGHATAVSFPSSSRRGTQYQVRCTICGCETPRRIKPEIVTNIWNRRSQ
jgi:hypothetical protein